ncbi:MAG: phytoene/squalene synthase family protein [Spirochaetaceae bacterium]|nr:MAG: phytoene/squalene synthase family protein [Spirochaetaceae bacterium]
MKVQPVQYNAFRNGSKTYFNSSRFFPASVRDDVFALYAFVRVADNYVDSIPQQADELNKMQVDYRASLAGTPSNDIVVDSFAELCRRVEIRPEWVDAFFHSMRLDLTKFAYDTLEETLEYIYGSAEVIGLCMARILHLHQDADQAACMLGRAMQYINFIRDIDEDNRLGRRYLPLHDSGLNSLQAEEARSKPDVFVSFVRGELARYRGWMDEAEKGYAMIPFRARTAVKTAGDMYDWTALTIERNPFVVYERKVKPKRSRVVLRGMGNLLVGAGFRRSR